MMLSLATTALGVWFSGLLECFGYSPVNLQGQLGLRGTAGNLGDGDSYLAERAHWSYSGFLDTLTIVYQPKPSLLLTPRPMKQNPQSYNQLTLKLTRGNIFLLLASGTSEKTGHVPFRLFCLCTSYLHDGHSLEEQYNLESWVSLRTFCTTTWIVTKFHVL